MKLTDLALRALKEDEYKTESLGRGRGALMVRRRGGSFLAFYRYWKGKQKNMVPLGSYKPTSKAAGFTLAQLREKALALATLRQDIAPADLKEHLEQQEKVRQQEAKERQQQEQIEASRGTLTDLIDSYVASLHRNGRKSGRQVKNMLERHCLEAFPNLKEAKARDITPDDIVGIISRMIDEGLKSHCNRVRSYLHAAFAYGLKADHDPLHITTEGKRFNLAFNPVAAVPRQAQFEQVRKRRLNDDEIRDMWQNIEKGKPTWSPLYGLLARFCLACYGNRPDQLNKVTWNDIDYQKRSLVFVDSKGKNAIPKERVIPLSQKSLDILSQAKAIDDARRLKAGQDEESKWPFSVTGKAPISVYNLAKFVQAYNKQYQPDEDYEPWTAKDLRRTATSLLTRLRIPKEQRYLLQSREDGSIESKHYDHDDRLPEKREAARAYTAELERIIEGKDDQKLADMEEYRRSLKF